MVVALIVAVLRQAVLGAPNFSASRSHVNINIPMSNERLMFSHHTRRQRSSIRESTQPYGGGLAPVMENWKGILAMPATAHSSTVNGKKCICSSASYVARTNGSAVADCTWTDP